MSSYDDSWRDVADRLKAPGFHGVVDDLVAFTGLSKKQVCVRIMKKRGQHKARGWFNEELKWHCPNNDREMGWFYRSAQSYLFSNARRPYWPPLDWLRKCVRSGEVLDYGGGIGTSSLHLAKLGYRVHFMEIGIVQQEFVRFRAKRHRVNVSIIDPCRGGSYDPVGPVDGSYDAILLQHVLEHIPNYHVTLRHLIGRLNDGGIIVEHSPFNLKKKDGTWRRNRPTHLEASMPLAKAMTGMRKFKRFVGGESAWKKEAKG